MCMQTAVILEIFGCRSDILLSASQAEAAVHEKNINEVMI